MDERSRRRGSRPPRPPGYLDDDAREIWRRVAAELWDAGTFREATRDLLARHSEVAALAARVGEQICGGKVLVKGRREGELVASPLWRIYRDAVGLQLALARELGLTRSVL